MRGVFGVFWGCFSGFFNCFSCLFRIFGFLRGLYLMSVFLVVVEGELNSRRDRFAASGALCSSEVFEARVGSLDERWALIVVVVGFCFFPSGFRVSGFECFASCRQEVAGGHELQKLFKF